MVGWCWDPNEWCNTVQRVSDVGVLNMGISAFDYGEWEVTTTDQPEGTGATISPQSIVINLGYAQKFTENIYGGANVKIYSSSISNLNTSGVCFDAGVQYRTGIDDRFKFGITLRNVGPGITYEGDGLGVTLPVPTYGVAYTQTFESRSAIFELPTALSIGGSYDWLLENGKVTGALNFTSNAFEKDTYHAGVQYSLKDLFQVRVGYVARDNRLTVSVLQLSQESVVDSALTYQQATTVLSLLIMPTVVPLRRLVASTLSEHESTCNKKDFIPLN